MTVHKWKSIETGGNDGGSSSAEYVVLCDVCSIEQSEDEFGDEWERAECFCKYLKAKKAGQTVEEVKWLMRWYTEKSYTNMERDILSIVRRVTKRKNFTLKKKDRKQLPPKPCENCAEPFIPKQKVNRFCGHSCSNKAVKRGVIKTTKDNQRRYLL